MSCPLLGLIWYVSGHLTSSLLKVPSAPTFLKKEGGKLIIESEIAGGEAKGKRMVAASTSLGNKVHPILQYSPQSSLSICIQRLEFVAQTKANSVSHTESPLWCICASHEMTPISYSPYCIQKANSTKSSVWVPHRVDSTVFCWIGQQKECIAGWRDLFFFLLYLMK